MSTDYQSEIYDKPCPCGSGRVTVTEIEPDHAYVRPSQKYYSVQIDCSICSELYEVGRHDDRGDAFAILKEKDESRPTLKLCHINSKSRWKQF